MRKPCLPLGRIFLSFLIVLSAAWATIGSARADGAAAQITGLRGSATLVHSGVRAAVVSGMVLSTGDTITTQAGARVKLRFADGSEVRLGENATLRIEAVTFDAAAGTRNILLRLPIGLLRAAATKLTKSTGSSFEIHTGVGYSAVRGTQWIVDAQQAETRIYVQEGRVAVGADFATSQFPRLVEAGHWLTVTPQGGIGAVQDSPPGFVDDLVDQTEASLAPGMPDDTLTTVTESANAALGGTTEAVSDLSDAVTGTAGDAVNQATSAVSNTVGALGSTVGGAVDQTASAVSDVTNAVGSATGGVVGQTTSAVSNTTSTLGNTVGQATSAVSSTTSALGSTVGGAVSTVGGAVPGGGKSSGSGSSGSGSSPGGSSGGGSSGGGSSGGGSSGGGSSGGGSSSGGSSSGGSSGGSSGSSSGGSSSGSGSSSGGSSSSGGGLGGGLGRTVDRALGGLL
jgi:hypothetical protein